MGPIVFNVHVDVLFSLVSSENIIGFGDDTAVFYEVDNWNILKYKVEVNFLTITVNLKKIVIHTIQLLYFRFNIFQLLESTLIELKNSEFYL